MQRPSDVVLRLPVSVQVIKEYITGKSRGFAFVTFAEEVLDSVSQFVQNLAHEVRIWHFMLLMSSLCIREKESVPSNTCMATS